MNQPRTGSSSGTRLVLVGAALVVLLGIVAFVSRGHVSPAGTGAHDRTASQWLANVVFTAFAVAMAVGTVLLVYVYGLKKHETKRAQFRLKPLVASLLFVAAVVLGMVFAFHELGNKRSAQKGMQRLSADVRKKQQGREHGLKLAKPDATRPQQPEFYWPLAGGLVALLTGISVTAVVYAHRRRKRLAADVRVTEQLAELVDETLDDLRAEADPRKAVIAAYARMERMLGVHGLPRRPSEAPLEYLTRVLLDLRVTEPSVTRLTALFERAKFSHHRVDEGMREQAIAALEAFRDEMRLLNREPEEAPPLPLQDLVGHGPT